MNVEDEISSIKFDIKNLQSKIDLLFRKLDSYKFDENWRESITNSVKFTLPSAIMTISKDLNKLKKIKQK